MTVQHGVGGWIELHRVYPVLMDAVVLYERPNLDDHVMGRPLSFSDGRSVAVGALDNAGAPLVVGFSPRLVTSLRFTVDAVTDQTYNVVLAEIEAY